MDNKPLSEIMNGGELYHHGVLGMKWGVRRFQPYSLIPRKSGKGGKETGVAKKASKSSKSSSSSKKANKNTAVKVSAIKKTRKQKSAEAKAKIETEAKTARQRSAELDKIVRSGNAKLVYDHRQELTKKQLDEAIDRINTEAKVSALVRVQNPTKLDKLKRLAGKADDINNIVKTGKNIYTTSQELRQLYDKAREADSAKKKAEISSNVVKDIVESGQYSSQTIGSLQSLLTDDDLAKLTKRATNMAVLDKNDKERLKRDRADTKDRDSFAKYISDKRANDTEYLRKSLSDIEAGKDTVDDWTDGGMKPSKTWKKKRNLKSARQVLNEDAKLFDATSENKLFDEYFEDEVKKYNKK